ncbi:hypothetical protein VTN02DRAFT_5046 [Thermoascus thermophilus]
MEAPSFKAPTSPEKAPLRPVSPERINQQNFSMSSDLQQAQRKTSKPSLDIPLKVASISGLSRSENHGSVPPSSTSAALQRAILGREEAESALAKVTSQLSEAQARERRISERVESLMQELRATKERQANERSVFEKEVRKARKEAFRASSNLVKLQEDLKLCREEIRGLKDEVKVEREAKERAQQEASESANTIAALSEENKSLWDEVRLEREARESAQQEASESASALADLTAENEHLKDEVQMEREARELAQQEASESANTIAALTAENEHLKDEVQMQREARESAQQETSESANTIAALTAENEHLKDEVQVEREARESAQQEASESASALADLTAENEHLKDELRVERDAKENAQREASESASALTELTAENEQLRDAVRVEREAKEQAQQGASENASGLADLTAEIEGLRAELGVERQAKENAQREACESASVLAELTEELNVLKEKLQFFETEQQSRALEARSRETQTENFGRQSLAQANPVSPTPAPQGRKRGPDDTDKTQCLVPENDSTQYDGETPPKKQKLSHRASPEEDQEVEIFDPEKDSIEDLRWELQWERQLRKKAEDMVHFMKMECQFKRCSCRLAESQGTNYVHDVQWDERSKTEHLEVEVKHEQDDIAPEPMSSHSVPGTPVQESMPAPEAGGRETGQEMATLEWVTTFSPKTGTFRTVPSPARQSVQQPAGGPPIPYQPSDQHFQSFVREASPQPTVSVPGIEVDHHYSERHPDGETMGFEHSSPSANQRSASPLMHRDQLRPRYRTPTIERETERATETIKDTVVKTVPLRPESDDAPSNPFANIPGTPISREEALAQIRARRGRARSVAQRSVSTGESLMRSGGMGMTPIRGARRIPGLLQTDTKSESDLGERHHINTPTGKY